MSIVITNENCREIIGSRLCAFPNDQRIALVNTICSTFKNFGLDCTNFTDCETVTSLSEFISSAGQVCITYTDEKGDMFERCFTIAENEIVITADSGVHKNTATNIQLGGDLLDDTTVTSNGFILTVAGLKLYDNGSAQLTSYGVGTFLDTPIYSLGVKADGTIIEFNPETGGSPDRFGVAGEDDTAGETRNFSLNTHTFDVIGGAGSYFNYYLDNGSGGNSDLYIDPTDVYLYANDGVIQASTDIYPSAGGITTSVNNFTGDSSVINIYPTEIDFNNNAGSYSFANLTENNNAEFYVVEQNGYIGYKRIYPNCRTYNYVTSNTFTYPDNMTSIFTGSDELSTITEIVLSCFVGTENETTWMDDLVIGGRIVTMTLVGDSSITATMTLALQQNSDPTLRIFNITFISTVAHTMINGEQYTICWEEPDAVITADNGLSKDTSTNVQLGNAIAGGAPLLHDTYIDPNGFFTLWENVAVIDDSGVVGIGIYSAFTSTRLNIVDNALAGGGLKMVNLTSTSTNNSTLLNVSATGSMAGIVSNTAAQVAITGQAVDATAISGTSVNGFGVSGGSTNSYAGTYTVNPASTNITVPVALYQRGTTGTAANNIGGSIQFAISNDTGGAHISNEIISKWTDATLLTRTSQFSITGVNSGTLQTILTISAAGIFTLTQGLSDFADDTAAAIGLIPVHGLYRTASVVKMRVT